MLENQESQEEKYNSCYQNSKMIKIEKQKHEKRLFQYIIQYQGFILWRCTYFHYNLFSFG